MTRINNNNMYSDYLLIMALMLLCWSCGTQLGQNEASILNVRAGDGSDIDEDAPVQEPVILSGAYLNCSSASSSASTSLKSIVCVVRGLVDPSKIDPDELERSLVVTGGSISDIKISLVDGVYKIAFLVPADQEGAITDISIQVNEGGKSRTIETVSSRPIEPEDSDHEEPYKNPNQDSYTQESNHDGQNSSSTGAAGSEADPVKTGSEDISLTKARALENTEDPRVQEEIRKLSAEAQDKIDAVNYKLESETEILKAKAGEDSQKSEEELAKIQEDAAKEIGEINKKYNEELNKLSIHLNLVGDQDKEVSATLDLKEKRDEKIAIIENKTADKIAEIRKKRSEFMADIREKHNILKGKAKEEIAKIEDSLKEKISNIFKKIKSSE